MHFSDNFIRSSVKGVGRWYTKQDTEARFPSKRKPTLLAGIQSINCPPCLPSLPFAGTPEPTGFNNSFNGGPKHPPTRPEHVGSSASDPGTARPPTAIGSPMDEAPCRPPCISGFLGTLAALQAAGAATSSTTSQLSQRAPLINKPTPAKGPCHVRLAFVRRCRDVCLALCWLVPANKSLSKNASDGPLPRVGEFPANETDEWKQSQPNSYVRKPASGEQRRALWTSSGPSIQLGVVHISDRCDQQIPDGSAS